MKSSARRRHRLLNGLQSLLLLGAMAAILAGLGWIVAGETGVIWALVGGAVLIVFSPGFSPRLILRMYGARPITPAEAPELYNLLQVLAQRAGLATPPQLYYIGSRMMNAFAVGPRSGSAIAVSDALLGGLSVRELAGVLAHEISHVRHNDMWVMSLADLFSRMTSLLSSLGYLLLLVSLPLLLFSPYGVSWIAILVLVFAPTLSGLIQLALSRTREYDADLGATELTGDPRGLAMALKKMERYQGRIFEQIFLPGRRVPEPSLLRTHPPTEERIRRLLALEAETAPRELPQTPAALPRRAFPVTDYPPRWHLNGMWY